VNQNHQLRVLRTAWIFSLTFVLATALAAQSGPQKGGKSADAAPRVRLQPRLVPGESVRYHVQFQTSSQTKRSGVIADPQGPSQTVVTWDSVLRVEVLPPPAQNPQSPAAAGTVRLRTTYEKSAATLQSDTPDPEQDNVENQYAQMQGRSLEFTLGANGRVSGVQGLEGIVSDQDAVKAAQQWVTQFSSSASVPPAGVAVGQKWTYQEPASSLPLAGRVWRTDSTYLRNEPCRPASLGDTPAPAAGEVCAVILAQLTLATAQPKKDPTPPDYRANGLVTSGTWTGTGQSLSYVSLATGWIVSVTQDMAEQMDVTLSNGRDVNVRYSGAVTTHSSMSLAPPDPAAAP
jgi:hypothetical protein